MKKFKTWLIHLLGGLTVAESKASDKAGMVQGAYFTLLSVKLYADRLNGVGADEWCRRMYGYISEQFDLIANIDHEQQGTEA